MGQFIERLWYFTTLYLKGVKENICYKIKNKYVNQKTNLIS